MNEANTRIIRIDPTPTEQWLDAALRDLERVFIMRIGQGNADLLAEMEYGEHREVRLQQMDFITDTTLPLYDAVIQCRDNYAVGIYIDDLSPLISDQSALRQFLRLREIEQYVICGNVILSDIVNLLSGTVCIVIEP